MDDKKLQFYIEAIDKTKEGLESSKHAYQQHFLELAKDRKKNLDELVSLQKKADAEEAEALKKIEELNRAYNARKVQVEAEAAAKAAMVWAKYAREVEDTHRKLRSALERIQDAQDADFLRAVDRRIAYIEKEQQAQVNAARRAAAEYKQAWDTALRSVGSAGGSITGAISGAAKGLFGDAKGLAGDIWGGMKSAAGDVLSTLKQVMEAAVGGTVAIGSAVGYVGFKYNELKQNALLSLESLKGNRQAAEDLFNYIDRLSDKMQIQVPDAIQAATHLEARGLDATRYLEPLVAMSRMMGRDLEQTVKAFGLLQSGNVRNQTLGGLSIHKEDLEARGIRFNKSGGVDPADRTTGKLAEAALDVLMQKTERFRMQSEGLWTSIASTAISNFRRVASVLTGGLFQSAIDAVSNLRTIFDVVLGEKSAIARFPEKAREWAGILPALKVPFDLLGKALEWVSGHAEKFTDWLAKILTKENVVTFIADIAGWMKTLADEVQHFVGVATGGQGLDSIWESFKNAAHTALNIVYKGWVGFTAAVEYFVTNSKQLWLALGEGFEFIKAGLEVVVGAFVVGMGMKAVGAVVTLIGVLKNLGVLLGVTGPAVEAAAGAASGGGAAVAAGARMGGLGAAIGAGAAALGSGAAGLGAGALIKGGANGDNLHDSMRRLLSDIGAGAATGGVGGAFVGGVGAIPGAILGGAIGAGVGGASEIYRWFRSRGASHEQAAAAATQASQTGSPYSRGNAASQQQANPFQFTGVLGGLQEAGKLALGETGGAGDSIMGMMKDQLPALYNFGKGGYDFVRQRVQGANIDDLFNRAAANSQEARGAINNVLGGTSGNGIPRSGIMPGGMEEDPAELQGRIDEMKRAADEQVAVWTELTKIAKDQAKTGEGSWRGFFDAQHQLEQALMTRARMEDSNTSDGLKHWQTYYDALKNEQSVLDEGAKKLAEAMKTAAQEASRAFENILHYFKDVAHNLKAWFDLGSKPQKKEERDQIMGVLGQARNMLLGTLGNETDPLKQEQEKSELLGIGKEAKDIMGQKDPFKGRFQDMGSKFDAQSWLLGDDPALAKKVQGIITHPDTMGAQERLLAPAQETAANTRAMLEELRQIRAGQQGNLADQFASYQRQQAVAANGRLGGAY